MRLVPTTPRPVTPRQSVFVITGPALGMNMRRFLCPTCAPGSMKQSVQPRGIALGILRPRWADFAILDEMDSTGSRMIRGAGEGLGSLYRMLGRFRRPARRQCRAARLS